MPQITLVDAGTDYDLFERLLAQSKGTVNVQTAAEIAASILPRTCCIRAISYPDIAPNTGTSLLIKDNTLTQIKRLDASDLETFRSESGDGSNKIPLLNIKLRGGAANSLVDVEIVTA
jgi:hypothetical protein